MEDLKFLLVSFFTWRISLFIFLLLALSFVPLQMNFLGGGLSNYLKAPYLWSFLNFDGEHYLSIAYQGYQPLTYFYFPAFPLLTKWIASLFNQSFLSLAVSGLLVSHLAFLIGLTGLIRLMGIDYKKDLTRLVILLLLAFPTSFYFASFYTESLFFALAVWSFYFARKGKWLYSAILGAVATATKVVGIVVLPALLTELLLQRREGKEKALFVPLLGVSLSVSGLLLYTYFLNQETGNPLEFFESVSIFGQQRGSELILLPRVFYRYIFKVLPNVDYSYFPVVFSTILEFLVAVLFTILSIAAFFRLRPSYAIYLAFGYIIPTLSGSFSSLPRYILVLFPAFIVMAIYLSKKPRLFHYMIFSVLLFLLGIATSLFVRGYWVS